MCEAFSLRSWRGLIRLVRPIPRRRGLVRELQGGKRRIEQLLEKEEENHAQIEGH